MKSIPILRVSSSHVAKEFYCDQLGFAVRFTYRPDESLDDPCYFGVTRDGADIHLSSFCGDGVFGAAVYVIVDDVDELHREFVARGISCELEPTDQTWGNRELYVRDPDGNSVRFVYERMN